MFGIDCTQYDIDPSSNNVFGIDGQFKIYYQFLKHHFGLDRIPINPDGKILIYIHLDEHSSQKHKEALKNFTHNLPIQLGRKDISIKLPYLKSNKSLIIQAVDLLIGAAGSQCNKMHKKRAEGQWGMSSKQKLRNDFCSHDNLDSRMDYKGQKFSAGNFI